MGYHFFGFTADAFEQFARAIALTTLGPGVTVFGDGPDGGREAIFNGTVPFPHPPTEQWSGYGVIQAKCKSKPEGTQKDQKWALDLLKEELETFLASERRTPKPEYYVFVTNVELAAGGKGWDAADQLVRSYYGKLPLKGHTIWAASQLSGYLDAYEEIRRRFTAYLTTGDVLAALIRSIEGRRPNTEQILVTFLSNSILEDETSRLEHGGKRTEEKVPLAHLFIDLPAFAEQSLSPPDEKPDDAGNLPAGVLAHLLRDGSRRLDPEAVYELETATLPGAKAPTRYVLLGGFGSGKSTVGQFLAQVHRAALLERRPQPLLEQNVRGAIAAIRAACEQERLPWPATPRYPFRVELARFAKALAEGKFTTLSDYLRSALKGSANLEHEDFLAWLKLAPWLLILDGLDEVPPSSNRDAVVTAVNAFLIEARQVGADLFVVATSRRDGYQGEFAGGVVAYRSFPPLSRPRALRYVEKYARARYGTTPQAEEVIEKLREVAEKPLTGSLMSSPLQVTFMVTVVAARGDPGQDRWQLFSKYYETIYDREQQKAISPYQEVLAEHKDVIDRLHHDIGFWLQYQGEAAGANAVGLQVGQLQQFVLTLLGPGGKGYEGPELGQLAETITAAARRRLIFLTSRVEDELTFEVRGLQEYMAAECLMTGETERVLQRLRAVTPSAYWRNVFLFAVGKCFFDAQSRHYQAHLPMLCERLNDPADPPLELIHAGSELSLSILESGAPAKHPEYTRQFSKLALELLAQPEVSLRETGRVGIAERLAAVYRESASSVYREALEIRIGQSNRPRTLGTWPLLVRLADRGHGWARDMVDRYWPRDVEEQVCIGKAEYDLAGTPCLRDRLNAMIPYMSLSDTTALLRGGLTPRIHDGSGAGSSQQQPSWLMGINSNIGKNYALMTHYTLLPGNSKSDPFGAMLTRLFNEDASSGKFFYDLQTMPPGHKRG